MIAVIGAGLAGLACGRALSRAGREVAIFEASDAVGGRVRTDHVGGFQLDRGFQVILDSYPTLRRIVPIRGLEPRWFASGALLWDRGRFWKLLNPLVYPASVPATLASTALTLSDKLALARLGAEAVLHSDASLMAACGSPRDMTIARRARKAGLSPNCIERLIRPFFGGVFLDPAVESSAALWSYYLKKFALGRAFVPAAGMGALPRLLAQALPANAIRLNSPVERIELRDGRAHAVIAAGIRHEVEAIVVAADAASAWRLCGLEGPAPFFRRVWAVSFAASAPLGAGPMLILPAGRRRIVRHLVEISAVAPEYSATGRPLVVCTVLDGSGLADAALGAAARKELHEMFPRVSLQLVDIRRVEAAVRVPAPGFASAPRPSSGCPNVVLAGDYLGASSIESALASGESAARAVAGSGC